MSWRQHFTRFQCHVRVLQKNTSSTKTTRRNVSSTTCLTSKWFFSKEAAKTAGHSSLVSDSDVLYAFHVEHVKPERWDDYLKHKKQVIDMLQSEENFRGELVASFHFIAGDDNFSAMHLLRYPKGWKDVDATFCGMNNISAYRDALHAERQMISRQGTEYMKSFSFWPKPTSRSGGNIYDVRSYRVKPGSMYDWGNYWAKGIKYRTNVREDIPWGGFFTQLGHLHTIYHIWCYKNLEDRRNCRDDSWQQPEWNNIVSQTVPLISSMKSRIMKPLTFSPSQ